MPMPKPKHKKPTPAPAQKAGYGSASAARKAWVKAEKLRRDGDLDGALRILEPLTDEFPDYVAALHSLGLVHIDREVYWHALSCFLRATAHNPKDPILWLNLAKTFFGLGAAEMAEKALNELPLLGMEDAEATYMAGEIHYERREYADAAACYEKTLALRADHPAAPYQLSRSYDHLGRQVDGVSVLRRAIENAPANFEALGALGRMPPEIVDIDVVGAIDRALAATTAPDDQIVARANFARATALDRRARHDEAWPCLLKANGIMHEVCRDAYKTHLRRTEFELTEAEKFSAKAIEVRPLSDRPAVSLFILGPSRAGKSTLERLLGAVAGVTRGYESKIVEDAVRRTSQLSGLVTLTRLAALPPMLESRFAELYAEELSDKAQDGRVLTNTHPGRIADVGRLAAILPNVRFVFVERERQDIALRMLMKNYSKTNNPYAYDLGTIYRQIDWYDRMAAIWREKLPDFSMAVSYEDMIADPRAVLHDVASFCGIEAKVDAMPELGDDRQCAAPYRDKLAET
jgi:tetratricopeptide (TPR) repeat protein